MILDQPFLADYIVGSSRILRLARKVSERLGEKEAGSGAYLNNRQSLSKNCLNTLNL